MHAAMKRWHVPITALLLTAACGTSGLDDALLDQPTRVRLEPTAFEGDVACVPGAVAALQSYVVSLYQVSFNLPGVDAGPPPAPITSPLAACDRAVLFSAIAGRSYAATINGFDHEVSNDQAATATPTWTASCGYGTANLQPDAGPDPLAPTVAVLNYTVPMIGCTSFQRAGAGADVARLVVDQGSALGALQCGSGPGRVSSFEAVAGSTRVAGACGKPLQLEFSGPARYYTIELTALEGPSNPGAALDAGAADAAVDAALVGADAAVARADAARVDAGTHADAGGATAAGDAGVGIARWRTQCIGHAQPGVTNLATCDPLSPITP
jgi:hypothetical protein